MLNTKSKFLSLSPGDVIHIQPELLTGKISTAFKLKQFINFLAECIFYPRQCSSCVETEIHCEVLKLGISEWQKGKIYISINFVPDEILSGENLNEKEDMSPLNGHQAGEDLSFSLEELRH